MSVTSDTFSCVCR